MDERSLPLSPAAQQRMAVLAIGCHHVVLRCQRTNRSGGYRFFPDVEVKEAANLSFAVELGAFFLQPPDAHHIREQTQREIARQRNVTAWWRRNHVRAPIMPNLPIQCSRVLIDRLRAAQAHAP